jgi:hypothetical protein
VYCLAAIDLSMGKELGRIWKEVVAFRCFCENFQKGKSSVRMATPWC